MKLKDLFEMTLLRAGEQTDEQLKPTFDFLEKEGNLVGDHGNFQIVFVKHPKGLLYGLKRGAVITTIAALQTTKTENLLQLDVVHTLEEYRGNKDAFRLLWFIKDQEGKSMIDYGVQTIDGMNFIDAIARSQRFGMAWYNIKTGEKKPYTGGGKSTYRSTLKQTNWRVLIEGDEDPVFPRFFNEFEKMVCAPLWQVFSDDDEKF